MRSFIFAAVIALPVTASAGVPPMTLPDMTFPGPNPDISTQGCTTDQRADDCKPNE